MNKYYLIKWLAIVAVVGVTGIKYLEEIQLKNSKPKDGTTTRFKDN